jgi:chromosome segregation ATPase
MNETAYRAWQVLHDRWAKGATLTPEEQAAYEAGCQELDAQEELDGNLERLRALRAKITEAKTLQQRLRTEEQDLDMRIATLEARLDVRTRELLGMAN